MTCQQFRDIVTGGTLEDMLPSEFNAGVAHPLSCPDCRSWIEQIHAKAATQGAYTPEDDARIYKKLAQCLLRKLVDPEL